MSRSSITEQFARTVGTFALIGPPVGTAVAWVWLFGPVLSAGLPADPSRLMGFLGSLSGSILVSLVVGYVLGVIPASLTGVICHFFAQAIPSDAAWVAACVSVGTAIGALMGFILTQSLALDMAILAVPAAAAAGACALKLRQERWT